MAGEAAGDFFLRQHIAEIHLQRIIFIFKVTFEKYVCLVKQYGEYSERIGYISAHENVPVSPRVPETFSKRVAVNLESGDLQDKKKEIKISQRSNI